MKTRYYILIGILSYLFFTLGNIPAAKVIALAEENTPMPARLYGVYGTLWSGGSEQLIVKGQPPVENLQWSINPASLLLAQVSGEVKASIKQQNIIGNFSISPGGTISASDVRARIDAPVIQELAKLPFGELGGVLNLHVKEFEFVPQEIPNITAEINWKSAKLTVLETVDLGNILVTLQPGDDDQITAKISNKNGQLSLKGSASLDPEKAYNVNLSITPDNTASDNVLQSLKMFARRQSDGSYQFKRKGNIQEFGL